MLDFSFWIFKKLSIQFHIIFCLKKKLKHCGIRGPAHTQLCSFLHRKQYVSADGIQPEIESITYDIVQGPILGPIFFLYVNDLNNSVNCLPQLFADDTCLLIDSTNLASLKTEMNKNLTNVYKWYIANELSQTHQNQTILSFPPNKIYEVPISSYSLMTYQYSIITR